MSDANKVVWSEGLFLRPQHLQQQDRHTDALVRGAMLAASHQNFGFRHLTLDKAALQAGQVGISAALGIFPDGTSFSLPDMTTGLKATAVTASTDAGHVMLGIPTIQPGTATVDPESNGAAGARYLGQIATVRDTIKGGADPTEIEIARLAPRLFLPGVATDGYSCMAVARINGLHADGSIALDPAFLPPGLVTAVTPWYATFLQEVLTGLDRIRQAHGDIVMRGAGASVENLLILELANSAHPRIAHMMAQDLFHPSELFFELAQVANHAENVWTVRIDNTDIINNSRIVLRVGGDMSEEMLRKIFVEQATIGSADEFDALWKSKLTGIPLKPLHSQPREIPYDGDRLCLELDRSSDHWAKLADAPGFVIGVAGKLDRPPLIDCYAVKR